MLESEQQNPDSHLHVSGANNTTFVGSVTMIVEGTNEYDSGDSGSGIGFLGKFKDDGQATTFGQIYAKKSNNASGDYDASLCFATRKTGEGSNSSLERMRISADGKVGIGTQAPKFGLDIKNKNGIAVRDSQAAQNSQTNMIRTTTSSVTHDDWGVGINVVNEDTASNGYGMAFWTRNAYNGSYSEKVRISRSGEVGIGNTASDGNYKLNVTGNIFASGNIVADGSITTQDFQVNGDFTYSGTMMPLS